MDILLCGDPFFWSLGISLWRRRRSLEAVTFAVGSMSDVLCGCGFPGVQFFDDNILAEDMDL